MSELTASVVHTVNGKDVIFRELSVAEVRQIFAAGVPDALGDSLLETVRLSDLPLFTSLTTDEIELLRPSQLRVAVKHCQAQNPDFFAMLARFNSHLARP